MDFARVRKVSDGSNITSVDVDIKDSRVYLYLNFEVLGSDEPYSVELELHNTTQASAFTMRLGEVVDVSGPSTLHLVIPTYAGQRLRCNFRFVESNLACHVTAGSVAGGWMGG